MLDDVPEECILTTCKAWLVQTKQAESNRFREAEQENEEVGLLEAKLVAQYR